MSSFSVTPSGTLIDKSKHEAFVVKCFENKLVGLNRIYQGSVNKFTKQSWHDYCLNKGPTLTVVQADNGRIFGGYTSQSWTKGEGNYDIWTKDDKAWLFSFDHSTQLKVKEPGYAICNYYGSLCLFGAGADLVIQLDGRGG